MRTSNEFYLFYAGMLYREEPYRAFDDWHEIPDEVKQGGYFYSPNDLYRKHWYRGDFTPILLEDVPKELRVLVLLLF